MFGLGLNSKNEDSANSFLPLGETISDAKKILFDSKESKMKGENDNPFLIPQGSLEGGLGSVKWNNTNLKVSLGNNLDGKLSNNLGEIFGPSKNTKIFKGIVSNMNSTSEINENLLQIPEGSLEGGLGSVKWNGTNLSVSLGNNQNGILPKNNSGGIFSNFDNASSILGKNEKRLLIPPASSEGGVGSVKWNDTDLKVSIGNNENEILSKKIGGNFDTDNKSLSNGGTQERKNQFHTTDSSSEQNSIVNATFTRNENAQISRGEKQENSDVSTRNSSHKNESETTSTSGNIDKITKLLEGNQERNTNNTEVPTKNSTSENSLDDNKPVDTSYIPIIIPNRKQPNGTSVTLPESKNVENITKKIEKTEPTRNRTEEKQRKSTVRPPFYSVPGENLSYTDEFSPEISATIFDRPSGKKASFIPVLPPQYNQTGINTTNLIANAENPSYGMSFVDYGTFGVGGAVLASIIAFAYKKIKKATSKSSGGSYSTKSKKKNRADNRENNSNNGVTTNEITHTLVNEKANKKQSEDIQIETVEEFIEVHKVEKIEQHLGRATLEKPPRKTKSHENQLKTIGQAIGGILKGRMPSGESKMNETPDSNQDHLLNELLENRVPEIMDETKEKHQNSLTENESLQVSLETNVDVGSEYFSADDNSEGNQELKHTKYPEQFFHDQNQKTKPVMERHLRAEDLYNTEIVTEDGRRRSLIEDIENSLDSQNEKFEENEKYNRDPTININENVEEFGNDENSSGKKYENKNQQDGEPYGYHEHDMVHMVQVETESVRIEDNIIEIAKVEESGSKQRHSEEILEHVEIEESGSERKSSGEYVDAENNTNIYQYPEPRLFFNIPKSTSTEDLQVIETHEMPRNCHLQNIITTTGNNLHLNDEAEKIIDDILVDSNLIPIETLHSQYEGETIINSNEEKHSDDELPQEINNESPIKHIDGTIEKDMKDYVETEKDDEFSQQSHSKWYIPEDGACGLQKKKDYICKDNDTNHGTIESVNKHQQPQSKWYVPEDAASGILEKEEDIDLKNIANIGLKPVETINQYPSFNIPKVGMKLMMKKQLKRRQIKSLDSGVHEIFGEYLDFTIPSDIKEDEMEEILIVQPDGTIKEEKVIIDHE